MAGAGGSAGCRGIVTADVRLPMKAPLCCRWEAGQCTRAVCTESRAAHNLAKPTTSAVRTVSHPATAGVLQIKRIQPFTMPLMSLAATALDQPKHRDEVIATMLQVWAGKGGGCVVELAGRGQWAA